MMNEIDKLVSSYFDWLKDNTTVRSIESSHWAEITTPYLDRRNDCVQIYAKKEDGGYLLSDDAYTIDDLIMSGLNIEGSKRRKEILRVTLNGFGVELNNDNSLTVKASSEKDFPIKKHNLLQAILAVNDMFFLSKNNVENLFFEDVEEWLLKHDIRFINNINFIGKTGYNHSFDFVIPKSNNAPDRILQTINNPKKDNIENVIFKWLDTKEVRSNDTLFYVVFNDSNTKLNSSSIDAIRKYDIQPILWSDRENSIKLLVS